MGFCILFPQLCGLRRIEVAEMKQIVFDLSDELEAYLYNPENRDIEQRESMIKRIRTEASERLNMKGYKI